MKRSVGSNFPNETKLLKSVCLCGSDLLSNSIRPRQGQFFLKYKKEGQNKVVEKNMVLENLYWKYDKNPDKSPMCLYLMMQRTVLCIQLCIYQLPLKDGGILQTKRAGGGGPVISARMIEKRLFF